ncbi:MAG: ElyC/SanA/YdcF family protein [Patescibacteria group bacterium]
MTWKRLFQVSGVLVAVFIVSTLSIVLFVQTAERSRISHGMEMLTPAPVGIILGASILKDGTPSDALMDRLQVGVDLYNAGKIQDLLVTGDDGQLRSNETAVMKRVLLEKGIPEEHILLDPHGYRTYESCKRAAEVYQIKDAIIITQQFHLPRALYLCTRKGIQSQGISADLHTYINIRRFTVREWLASALAWWETAIKAPKPPVVYP